MLKLWASIARTAQDRKIDSDEKKKLIELFGETLISKALSMLQGLSKHKVNEIIKSKISENLKYLKRIDPDGASVHFNKIKKEVSVHFGDR